jgi:transposase-like protein
MQKTNSKTRKKRIPDDKKIESVMDYINHKKSISIIASDFKVSEQAVRDWVKKYQNSTQADLIPSIENVTDCIYTNITPIPLVYTLEEAASVAKISTNQLLHYAVLGKITLFFDRPIDVLAMTKEWIKFSRYPQNHDQYQVKNTFSDALDSVFAKLVFSFKYNFLVVSQSDCKCLEMGLNISKYNFHGVYWVDENNELAFKKEGADSDNGFYTLSESLVKDKRGECTEKDCHSIHISKKMLKVSSKELEELISSEIKRKANRVPSQEQFAVHENKSTFLVELDQAAFELWGDFNPIKAAVFNTTDKVAEYLVDNFHFCTANALPLAIIISPSANNPILPTKEDAKEITYRPRLLSGVIQAWGAVCMAKKFVKGDNSIKYEEMARKWLTDNWPELTKYEKIITNVVKLITPDNALFYKLRKSKK